jgi:septal ring factor EnvC (AmiA/AmiB activator)
MNLSTLVDAAEITGGVALFLMLVFRQIRQGARDAWREEAEAQTAKAARFADDVSRLIDEVRLLRDENGALREEVRELRAENRELREHIDLLLGN